MWWCSAAACRTSPGCRKRRPRCCHATCLLSVPAPIPSLPASCAPPTVIRAAYEGRRGFGPRAPEAPARLSRSLLVSDNRSKHRCRSQEDAPYPSSRLGQHGSPSLHDAREARRPAGGPQLGVGDAVRPCERLAQRAHERRDPGGEELRRRHTERGGECVNELAPGYRPVVRHVVTAGGNPEGGHDRRGGIVVRHERDKGRWGPEDRCPAAAHVANRVLREIGIGAIEI